jgi:uncharacterized protein YjbI with pentapeptide repeats
MPLRDGSGTAAGRAGPDRLELADQDLTGSVMTRVTLSQSRIHVAKMIGMKIEDVNMSSTEIENADLSGMTFRDVTFEGSAVRNANLRGVRIANADLTGMTINGILVSDLLALWETVQDETD